MIPSPKSPSAQGTSAQRQVPSIDGASDGATVGGSTLNGVPTVRFFAAAREAAGTGAAELDGATVAEVLAEARRRFGSQFADVLGTCRIWVNGDAADPTTDVGPHDEVAVLPPVSGG